MSVRTEARRDAEEYARAQMYFGEGAGNRRKLIDATVTSKILRDPVYAQVFREEYAKQDMGEHASMARRERDRRDRADALGRNVKGLATGNLQSVSSPVLILIVGAVVAHKFGLDKKAMEEFRVFKLRYRMWREQNQTKRQHVRRIKVPDPSDFQDHNGPRSTPWYTMPGKRDKEK